MKIFRSISALLSITCPPTALTAAAMFAGTITAAEPADPIWEPWQEVTIKIGNERNGFNDTVTARRRLNRPEACGGIMTVPYLVRVPEDNRLLLSCGAGIPIRGVISESRDNGDTWSPPAAPGISCGMLYGLTYCGNGVVIACDGKFRSTDYGRSGSFIAGWDNDPRFNTPIYGWDPALVFPDSDGKHLLLGGYYWKFFENPEAKVQAVLKESFDGGLTWSEWRGIPEFNGVTEVTMAFNNRGEIVAALRACTLMAPACDQSDRIETSISTDGGKTWSPPKVAAGNGCHHPSLALLPDGRMVMSYVVRMGYPDKNGRHRYGIEALVSNDGGHTWDTDHRYVLSEWEHDANVRDDQGEIWHLERFYPAPQGSSTIYLPEEDCLLTAYGTAQNLARINSDNLTYPRQVGMVKWKPLSNYSGKVSAPPDPVPVDKALRQIRDCVNWIANYNAASGGLPDAGWIDRYPQGTPKVVGPRLRLDHRRLIAGLYSLRGVDQLEFHSGPALLRMKLRVLSDADPQQRAERMTVYTVLGNGQNKYDFALFVMSDAQIVGEPFNGIKLPTRPDREFLLEIHLDPVARRARLWVDGKLIADREYTPHWVAPETPASLYFGKGTQRTGGVIEVGEFKLGKVE